MASKKRKKHGTKSKAAKKAKRAAPLARPKKTSARRGKRAAAPKSAARKPAARKASGAKSASKKSVARPKSDPVPAVVRRRDRPGHIDPAYARELRGQSGAREEDRGAFLDRPRSHSDDLAEERGEGVIEKATTGEDEGEEVLNQFVPEEQGGPFVETNAGQEFAFDTDASNPKDAKREPFPTT